MKNIHVIKTDKPSRFTFRKDYKYYRFRKDEFVNNDTYQNQHIYITSDEEIKEGDWFISNLNEILKCTKKEDKFVWYERLTVPGVSKIAQPFSIHINLKPKKIILTTDQDLIKDGVWGIEDEFLKWFVKNPTCEEVQIKIEIYPCMSDGSEITFAQPANLGDSKDIRNNIYTYNKQEHTDTKNFVKAFDKKRYKIIIPKEEPKQETVEEAARNTTKKYVNEREKQTAYLEFIEGVKWKEERSYSEEEVIEILSKRTFDLKHKKDNKTTIEWFKRFRKINE